MLNKKEKDLKKQALAKIEDELPKIEGIKEVEPKKTKSMVWVYPLAAVGAASIIAAIAVPLALNNFPNRQTPVVPGPGDTSTSQHESSTNQSEQSSRPYSTPEEPGSQNFYIALHDLLDNAGFYGDHSELLPFPTLKMAYDQNIFMYRIKRGYDETGLFKYVITVDKATLEADSYYQENGNDYSGWFLYDGGCIVHGNLMESACAYRVDITTPVETTYNGQEVLGVAYEGKMIIMDDLLEAVNPDYPQFPVVSTDYFWVPCDLGEDGTLIEHPQYGYLERLCNSEYSISRIRELEGGRALYKNFYPLPSTTAIVDGSLYLGGNVFFYEENSFDPVHGAPFVIEALRPYAEDPNPLNNQPITYDELKEIVLDNKAYYMTENEFETSVSYQKEFVPEKSVMEGFIFRSYAEWTAYQKDEDVKNMYDSNFFDGAFLIQINVADISGSEQCNTLGFSKSFKKGGDVFIGLVQQSVNSPSKRYGRTLFLKVPNDIFTYPNVYPLARIYSETQKEGYKETTSYIGFQIKFVG